VLIAEAAPGRVRHELEAVERVEGKQHVRALRNLHHTEKGERGKLDRHYRTEQATDARGTAPLQHEQADQQRKRNRNDVGLEQPRRDLESADVGRQNVLDELELLDCEIGSRRDVKNPDCRITGDLPGGVVPSDCRFLVIPWRQDKLMRLPILSGEPAGKVIWTRPRTRLGWIRRIKERKSASAC
jgi:hypothetical protein